MVGIFHMFLIYGGSFIIKWKMELGVSVKYRLFFLLAEILYIELFNMFNNWPLFSEWSISILSLIVLHVLY
jgi:hypothetical protein